MPRSIARRDGIRLFLVGGAVRDLLLGRPVRDIDLAVEAGSAAALARSVGEALHRPVKLHGRFGTATVALASGEWFDFAATRRETYDRPGALPRVEAAPIEEDLFRRDFTINAMALEISSRVLRLHDPWGGRADLDARLLTILHRRSFQDDPTRAFRAARYANRLGFSVDAASRRALQSARRSGAFEAVSGDRLRRELVLLLSEPHRAGAVEWMARLRIAGTLHPRLRATAAALSRLQRAERLQERLGRADGWLLYLLVWAADLEESAAGDLARRLALAPDEGGILRGWPGTLVGLSKLSRAPRPSQVSELSLTSQELCAAAVCSSRRDLRRVLEDSLSRPPVLLAIGGRDLLRAGLAPGPAVGRALARTLAARQDGKIPRDRELEFALKVARSQEEESA